MLVSPKVKEMAPITRWDAKALGLTRFFTGKPCKHNHLWERLVSNGHCVKCLHLRHYRASKATPEKRKIRNRIRMMRRKATPEKHAAWRAKEAARIKRSPRAILMARLRTRVGNAVKFGNKGGSAVRDLGCSVPFFRDYIASMFVVGMSWDNWGKWHLDHIQPLSSFDLTDREQFLKACHYTNYQPLWGKDNLEKADKRVWMTPIVRELASAQYAEGAM